MPLGRTSVSVLLINRVSTVCVFENYEIKEFFEDVLELRD